MLVGWLGEGKASDEVVLRVVTPEEIEIHGHGGPEAVALLEETLVQRGATLVAWQQLEAAEPSWRTEALEVLSQCATVRTAGIALDQLQGAFHRAVAEIAELKQGGNTAEATKRIRRLHDLATVGEHLVHPWKVVLAGPPNVGKSSLINALTGFQRSVVSPIAGTTRDVVTSQVALDGWPIVLADTAGLRTSHDPLEREGVDRSQRMLADADLCVWVVDLSSETALIEPFGKPMIVAANKCDLPSRRTAQEGWIPLSARTGEGLDHLVAAIVRQLIPSPPSAGEAVSLRRDWVDVLSRL
ncbi:MAG: 50S ribosome-binding GTPase [Gemmataceae bacterium]|nr:50S ribosome-binding GTPase [Gemmataceae bacterium]